jgi:beta-galactosidase
MVKNKHSNLALIILGGIILFLLIKCQAKVKSDSNTYPATLENKNYKPGSFFPKADLMKIGVYYYPEQWPREQWSRDFKNIAGYGFEFTHLAEFSWTFLEPKEGVYDFSWLDEAIDLAAKAGLKVILCTPTLCPPAWMGNKYPEIYLVGSDGRRREHGIRANASLSNPEYQKYVDKIVTAMADHYADDHRIWLAN